MIKIQFALHKADFLMYQLFVASQSSKLKERRNRTKKIIPLLYLILGAIMYVPLEQPIFGAVFAIIAVGWFFFWPIREKSIYLKYYGAYADEYYINRYGEQMELVFDAEYIYMKTNYSESKIILSHIERLDEIRDYFFIKLLSGASFILPKKKIADFEKIKEDLLALLASLDVKYNCDLEWEWK